MSAPLRLGTRRRRLATTQSGWVADLLRSRGHAVEIVPIVTEGDVNAAPLTQIGGTGVFASAIRQALHEERIDLAVHSLKDLPVAPEPGLVIAGIPPREDPRDALCARDGLTLEALPAGARVGTGSPRRVAQLRTRRPDLDIVPLRGNVETRLQAVADGRLDAILLAYAGLTRLGLRAHVTQVLPTQLMLPAPGQGALAVECRTDREDVVAVLRDIDDAATRRATSAERALLAALEAGCTAPIGALAVPDGETGLLLEAFAGTDTADLTFRDALTGAADAPEALGAALAQRLLDAGAHRLAGQAGQRLAPPSGSVTRDTRPDTDPPHDPEDLVPPGASTRAAATEKIQECQT